MRLSRLVMAKANALSFSMAKADESDGAVFKVFPLVYFPVRVV